MAQTIVQTKDGPYTIPTGERGSFAWAREASLIAKAYRDADNYRDADRWQREYERRLLIWQQVAAGRDLDDIIAAAEPDLLAPVRIVSDLVGKVAEATGNVAEAAGKTALTIADVLPYAIGGVVLVLVIVASKGNLKVA